MRCPTETTHIAGKLVRKWSTFAVSVLLAVVLTVSCTATGWSQGLHIPPDGFDGTWEDYIKQEKQKTQNTQVQMPLWNALHQCGLGKVVSPISLGERIKQQAWQWHFCSEFDKAEECHKKAIAVAADATEQISLNEAYAGFLESRGRYAEEVQIRMRVLQLSEKSYGKDHTWVAHVLTDLAEAYGRVVESERVRGHRGLQSVAAARSARANQVACYQRALGIMKRSVEPMDIYSYYPDTMRDLAVAYDEEGRVSEAEAAFRQALAWRIKHDNSDSLKIALTRQVAEFYIRHGKTQAAEPLLKSVPGRPTYRRLPVQLPVQHRRALAP